MSRLAVCAVLFAASCLLVAQRPQTAVAQDKKNVAALEKQLAAFRQDIIQGEKQLAALRTANAKLVAENNRLESLVKKNKAGDAKDDKTIQSLQSTINGYRGAGLVHVVVLKLKSDSPSGEAQAVIDDTYAQLSKIKSVRGVWAGKPSAKATPDSAADYTVAAVFVFDDAAGLKAYQNDPIHTKFVDKHLKKWETPVVYDFTPKKAAP